MSHPVPYDWSQFFVTMYYAAPRAELFQRWATSRGLESFFVAATRHVAPDGTVRAPDEVVQRGDRYYWKYIHDFEGEGTFTNVETNRCVGFTFGSMNVDVRFRDVSGGTEVALHQTNCATEDPDRAWQHLNCRSCWIYFFTNLRSVLSQNVDLRDHDHPQWNDSVSIGWDPTRVPGA